MQFYTLDPLRDRRWEDFVALHPEASVFHQTGWLKALARTYDYVPTALTSAPPGMPLDDGVVFCEVKSWITGRRLVSLPFADHSEPLLNDSSQISGLREWMRAEWGRRHWRYIELRPLSREFHSDDRMKVSQSFWFHTLDLSPSIEQIFQRCHKSCIQRRVLHAMRQGLSYEKGSSEQVLKAFYRLLVMTRRRHKLLPQPISWFRNLLHFMGPDAEIRLLRSDDTPVAAILTLRHRGTVVFKYGCSDQRFHHLGGMPLLFWKLIEESKADGANEIDLGRSEVENVNLVRFKDRLGALRTQINYLRYTEGKRRPSFMATHLPAIRALSTRMPEILSTRASELIYRHFG